MRNLKIEKNLAKANKNKFYNKEMYELLYGYEDDGTEIGVYRDKIEKNLHGIFPLFDSMWIHIETEDGKEIEYPHVANTLEGPNSGIHMSKEVFDELAKYIEKNCKNYDGENIFIGILEDPDELVIKKKKGMLSIRIPGSEQREQIKCMKILNIYNENWFETIKEFINDIKENVRKGNRRN